MSKRVPDVLTTDMIWGFYHGHCIANGVDTKDVEELVAGDNGSAQIVWAATLYAAPNLDGPDLTGLEDLGAFKRNLERLKLEAEFMWGLTKDAIKRWFKKPWSLHDFTNIFVETLRASPYFWGHVWVVALLVFLGVVAYRALV